MVKFDYLIVGAGFFGATFARLATDAGKKCLVIDYRDHIGGNAYSKKQENIHVHVYGPHIFHTNNDDIWNFVNRFSKFNNFILSPKAYYKGKLFSLPFNMNTFYEMWGTLTPEEAKIKIETQKLRLTSSPKNLEEQALFLVGTDIYETLIKGYTQKQWQKDPRELPSNIIKRLPIRFTYNNNYFNDKYQGIPVDGYTKLFENMLSGIEVRTSVDYFKHKVYYDSLAEKIVYTGKIDEFYDYKYGELEYRSLEFKTEIVETENFQGNSVVNYTEYQIPYTRIIEHKHFNNDISDVTIITKEYPKKWSKNEIPYYPINDLKNTGIFEKYRAMSKLNDKYIFGGRLAEYQYYDMHQVIGSAFKTFNTLRITHSFDLVRDDNHLWKK